jgi:hypothetical protein
MQGHRATRSSDSLVRRGSSFLSTLGIGDHPSLLGTRDPKGDGRRRLAASKGDAGDPVGALPAPSAGEQTPQIANHASVYGSGAVMGTGFISKIHSHRPHCTACVGKKLTRRRQGARRSSIGIWSVFSARTLQPSQEKLNGALWA